MNSSESNQPLKDPLQITFVMLNRFWSLSKKPFTSPPSPILPHSQCTMGCQPQGTFIKSYIRYSYQFLYFLFYISFYISSYQFCNFLEFHSILSEKYFRRKFSFFNRFTPFTQPQPLNGQNLLKWFFLSIFPKMSSEIFFSINLLTKSCKAFWKVSTTGSLVFFSKHSSTTAILTSVITCE